MTRIKRTLCLSLATAIAFTSTLCLATSATVSGEETNEGQNFGSAILDELFSE